MRAVSKERIERVARMYSDNKSAGEAIGIAPGSFSRLCTKYGIDTPIRRRRARKANGRKAK